MAIVDHGRIIALDTPARLIAEHGRGIITLDADKLDHGLQARLEKLPSVQSLAWADGKLELQASATQQAVLETINFLAQENITMRGLNIEEADLESVFLKLTGKHLRDANAPEEVHCA